MYLATQVATPSALTSPISTSDLWPFPCRLIVDPPAAGSWNMAVDEALLAAAVDDGVATLRFYQWNEPTLSLGYFQRYDDRQQHAASRDCCGRPPPKRRRRDPARPRADVQPRPPGQFPLRSQCGATLHNCPRSVHRSPVAARRHPLFRWNLRLRAERHQTKHVRQEPFLCFQRQARGDIVLTSNSSGAIQTWKILGTLTAATAGRSCNTAAC